MGTAEDSAEVRRWWWWTPVLDQDNAEVRKVIVVDPCAWSGQCWGEEDDRGGHLYLIRSVLRWGHLYLIRTVLRWGRWSWWNLYLIRSVLRWGRWSWWTPVLDQDSAEMRMWSWWTPVLYQDSTEVRKVIVVGTWSGQCWDEKVIVVDICTLSGQYWGEEGDRIGHLYLIRTILRRGGWSYWTPVHDQDSAEMRKWSWWAPDQDSAGERKIIVVDTCTWSGQCWGEEGDRGGHPYLIRTVLRRWRWWWWTPVLDQDSTEMRKVIVVDWLSRNLCDKFSNIPFTNGCLMQ